MAVIEYLEEEKNQEEKQNKIRQESKSSDSVLEKFKPFKVFSEPQ